MVLKFAASLLLVVCCGSAFGETFRVLSWNVESNRPEQPPVSDAATIGKQLTDLLKQPATKADIITLSEVEPKSFGTYVAAASEGLQKKVDYATSASGGFLDTDCLIVMVNSDRFEILDAIELHRYAGIIANFNVAESKGKDIGTLRARSPLALRIRDKISSSEFWFIANHLARGEADLRKEQARMLRQWAADRKEPVITAGDFNFDYDFKTQQGNDGYQAMMEGGVWTWLKPDPLIDSNWSDDNRVKDRRVDRYPDSILDFVFVANGAKNWKGESDVIVRDGDFPDDEKTSDHRPLITTFEPIKE